MIVRTIAASVTSLMTAMPRLAGMWTASARRAAAATGHTPRQRSTAGAISVHNSQRDLDLAIELPEGELEAVASAEQMSDVLDRIAAHVKQHAATSHRRPQPGI
jgi:hypothetical protein